MNEKIRPHLLSALASGAMLLVVSVLASAHCDTVGGPVVGAARAALRTHNVSFLQYLERMHETPGS